MWDKFVLFNIKAIIKNAAKWNVQRSVCKQWVHLYFQVIIFILLLLILFHGRCRLGRDRHNVEKMWWAGGQGLDT